MGSNDQPPARRTGGLIRRATSPIAYPKKRRPRCRLQHRGLREDLRLALERYMGPSACSSTPAHVEIGRTTPVMGFWLFQHGESGSADGSATRCTPVAKQALCFRRDMIGPRTSFPRLESFKYQPLRRASSDLDDNSVFSLVFRFDGARRYLDQQTSWLRRQWPGSSPRASHSAYRPPGFRRNTRPPGSGVPAARGGAVG